MLQNIEKKETLGFKKYTNTHTHTHTKKKLTFHFLFQKQFGQKTH